MILLTHAVIRCGIITEACRTTAHLLAVKMDTTSILAASVAVSQCCCLCLCKSTRPIAAEVPVKIPSGLQFTRSVLLLQAFMIAAVRLWIVQSFPVTQSSALYHLIVALQNEPISSGGVQNIHNDLPCLHLLNRTTSPLRPYPLSLSKTFFSLSPISTQIASKQCSPSRKLLSFSSSSVRT